MKRPRLTPPTLLSDTIIERITSEVAATGKAQIVRDSHCPGLRLVVLHSRAPVWMLILFNPGGRKEERLLGRYPHINTTQARAKGWDIRLRLKGPERHERPSWGGTLERLIFQYEGCSASHIAKLRSHFCYAFKPFLFLQLRKLDQLEVQRHIDTYDGPGGMRALVPHLNAMLSQAAAQGLIARSSTVFVAPKARNKVELARLRSQQDLETSLKKGR
jgi:hypothetical protein